MARIAAATGSPENNRSQMDCLRVLVMNASIQRRPVRMGSLLGWLIVAAGAAQSVEPALLIRILSASIAPVIVISGVALLVLSMSNRYSHVIDRARDLVKEIEITQERLRHKLLVDQVRIIYRRARILRLAIILGSVSILFVAVTVLSLFAEQVFGLKADYFSVPCFGLSLLALLGSLFFFIRDVGVSLAALELEIGPRAKDS